MIQQVGKAVCLACSQFPAAPSVVDPDPAGSVHQEQGIFVDDLLIITEFF